MTTKIYFDYTQAMAKFKAAHESAVKDFLYNYPQYIEEAKKRLNGLFKQEDYPPVDKVKKLFSFSLQFYPLPAANDFRVELGSEEINRIKADLESQLKSTEQEAVKDLWSRLFKTVSHAAERLGDRSELMQIGDEMFFEEATGTVYNFEWLEFWLTLWWIQQREYTPTTNMFKVFVDLARQRKREERGRV